MLSFLQERLLNNYLLPEIFSVRQKNEKCIVSKLLFYSTNYMAVQKLCIGISRMIGNKSSESIYRCEYPDVIYLGEEAFRCARHGWRVQSTEKM